MPNPTAIRLSEVIDAFARKEANDRRWLMMEHQLTQAKISLREARNAAEQISLLSENDGEAEIADGCVDFIESAYIEFLAQHAALLALISDSDVSERVGDVEL